MPRRIRRRRAKGWTLAGATGNPNGAVAVDRTSRWGNPFAVRPTGDAWAVVDARCGRVVGRWGEKRQAQRVAVDRFLAHLRANPELVERARHHLAGRDLACYCGEDDPCHADVWLALVNPTLGGSERLGS